MNIQVSNNKEYLNVSIIDSPDLFSGWVSIRDTTYSINVDILTRLAKELGFTYDLYQTLLRLSEESAYAMVKSMCSHSHHEEVVFLIDNEEGIVLGYSLERERLPILNSVFINRVLSLASTSDEVEISEYHYLKEDTISYVILRRVSPITVEETYLDKESKFIDYDIGVLLVNDETYNTYSRLVLYVGGQPLYLPASLYNTTTTRYKRSTDSSESALEVLVLRLIDDLRSEDLVPRIQEVHYRYRSNKYILSSYEEYNSLMKTMRRIPAIVEDSGYLENLVAKYNNFEGRYPGIEDQRSSYIWRCTALSDVPVGALIEITTGILSEISSPAIEYYAIRELLGSYISTNRIADEIAKESIN